MSEPTIRMLTDGKINEGLIRALFRDELDRGEITLRSYYATSGAIGAAEFTLIEYPDVAVILVFNAGDEEDYKIEERQATIHRILYRDAPDGWHVTLAVPDVDAWVMADPEVRAAFEADEATRANPRERSKRIGPMAEARAIDREAIAHAHPEFASLMEFLASRARIARASA